MHGPGLAATLLLVFVAPGMSKSKLMVCEKVLESGTLFSYALSCKEMGRVTICYYLCDFMRTVVSSLICSVDGNHWTAAFLEESVAAS